NAAERGRLGSPDAGGADRGLRRVHRHRPVLRAGVPLPRLLELLPGASGRRGARTGGAAASSQGVSDGRGRPHPARCRAASREDVPRVRSLVGRPVLWQFTYSHFNEKARWALDFKGVPHVRRSLLPGPHAVKIRRMTGQSAVPVLELDGRAIHDSSRIIAALEEAYPDPPLYPRDQADRRRAIELEDFLDDELGPHIRRYAFYLLLPFPDTVVAMFSQ